MLCTQCGQEGRKEVTVTVPAPLPAIRPEAQSRSPADLAVITRRKTGPEGERDKLGEATPARRHVLWRAEDGGRAAARPVAKPRAVARYPPAIPS